MGCTSTLTGTVIQPCELPKTNQQITSSIDTDVGQFKYKLLTSQKIFLEHIIHSNFVNQYVQGHLLDIIHSERYSDQEREFLNELLRKHK